MEKPENEYLASVYAALDINTGLFLMALLKSSKKIGAMSDFILILG